MKFIRPRTRPIPGQMNKLEGKYANHLEMLKKAGEIDEYVFEGCKLKLADKTTYSPDFIVVKSDVVEMHEVKGYWEDDARVKIKVAANKFWWMKFVAVKWEKGWVYEEF